MQLMREHAAQCRGPAAAESALRCGSRGTDGGVTGH